MQLRMLISYSFISRSGLSVVSASQKRAKCQSWAYILPFLLKIVPNDRYLCRGEKYLSRQKVSPDLSLFSREMTTKLEFECGNEAKGKWSLLRMLNYCVMQPLLTISVSNLNKVKDSMVFSSPDDICLKFF